MLLMNKKKAKKEQNKNNETINVTQLIKEHSKGRYMRATFQELTRPFNYNDEDEALLDIFNELDKNGWELIASYYRHSSFYIFKKKRKVSGV